MPPKKSILWKHYQEDIADPTNVFCQVPGCKKPKVSRGKTGSTRGNLSNVPMSNHLKNNHPKEFEEFTKAKKDKDAEDEKKAEEEQAKNEMEDGDTVPLWHLKTHKQKENFLTQTNLGSWVTGRFVEQKSRSGAVYDIHDPRSKDRHRGILSMVVLDLQPWTFVSDPGFIYYSSRMDPHYKVASTTFYRELLGKAYKKGVATVQEKLRKDDPIAIACQLDGWSSYRHGYIGMLIDYISSSWKRVNLCLTCSPFDDHHSGQALGNWLEDKLGTWQVLDKTTVVISDTASNMLKMMEFLPNDMEHLNCLNHVLQLTINDEVFEKPELAGILANVKAVANYANVSVLFSSAIKKKQEELNFPNIRTLIQDVKTRWNSTCDMTERFVELKEAIIEVLESEEWKGKILVRGTGAKVKFSNNDWRIMERVVQVLKPFKEATVKLSSRQACVSECIPILASLHHTLKLAQNNSDKGLRDLKLRLDQNLEQRTEHIENSDLYSVATLLDWRYKNSIFKSADSKKAAERRLVDILKREVSPILPLPGEDLDTVDMLNTDDETNNNTRGCLEEAFEALRKKARHDEATVSVETEESVVKEFLNSKLEKQNLANWARFETESQNSPIKLALCRLAKKFLTPPPTSTNTERLFSVAGQVMDENRARTLPDSLDKILFLRENIVVCNFNLDW